LRIADCGLLIPNPLPGTAGCEAAIEIFFNPQSAIRNPQSTLPTPFPLLFALFASPFTSRVEEPIVSVAAKAASVIAPSA
jgi:hypothetical protein